MLGERQRQYVAAEHEEQLYTEVEVLREPKEPARSKRGIIFGRRASENISRRVVQDHSQDRYKANAVDP
jgi:hypothetical protein